MNENDKVLDQAISHQIGLQRYGTQLTNKVIEFLNGVEADIVSKMSRSNGYTKESLESLLDYIREKLVEYKKLAASEVRSELKDFAVYEAEYQTEKLSKASGLVFNKPPDTLIQTIALQEPFQGKLLSEWFSELPAASYSRLRDQIRIGFTEGESVPQLVKRVRGTKSMGYKDGVLEISRRDAETVVRTAISHIANSSRKAVYDENKDLIKGVLWVSVLDSRTSDICMARSGKIYKLDEAPPIPAHPRCRSTLVPVIDGIPLPNIPTYNKWLQSQPMAVIEDALGKTRAKLFKSGALPVDRFVDRKGQTLTLAELRKRDKAAFDRAGL